MFGEIKIGVSWTSTEGVQRLPEQSEHLKEANYSLHRCSVFKKIKKGANLTSTKGVQRLPEHSEQVH